MIRLPPTPHGKLSSGCPYSSAHLHKKRLIHRDIKTANLLVSKAWTCSVADFGISTVRPTVTRAMTCIGTPAHMAPEVLQKEKYSESADVYSFAVVLFELFAGIPAFSEGDFATMNIAVLNGAIIDGARPSLSKIPSKMATLIEDCWAQDPNIRPDFTEIVSRLKRLKQEPPEDMEV